MNSENYCTLKLKFCSTLKTLFFANRNVKNVPYLQFVLAKFGSEGKKHYAVIVDHYLQIQVMPSLTWGGGGGRRDI